MLSEGDIARIMARIVDGYAPLVVGIFGSYAIGSAHEGSDLDVLVIKQTLERPTARRLAVRRLLPGLLCPADIAVFTPAEFEEGAYDEPSFNWVVARQARLFLWSEEASRCVPSLRDAGLRTLTGAPNDRVP